MIFLESNDLVHNLDNWKKQKGNNILFVTGLSGSGKTTIAKEISESRSADIISLDDFRNNSSRSSIDIVVEFKKKYPNTKKHFANKWNDNVLFEEWFPIFFDFVINYCKNKSKNLFVIEGIQIYLMGYEQRYYKDKPVIVKRVTPQECVNRQEKRGSKKINNINRLNKDSHSLDDFISKLEEDRFIKKMDISVIECVNNFQ